MTCGPKHQLHHRFAGGTLWTSYLTLDALMSKLISAVPLEVLVGSTLTPA